MSKAIHVVTGAFGYSGKYIAKRLLDEDREVITLTNSWQRENPFEDRVKAFPFNFDNPDKLVKSLKGAGVLYNTYWVRFNFSDNKINFKHNNAVENTLKLFSAARAAGVRRIVHVSITNPSLDSPLEYFSGKAKLEKALIDSGLSYAILRPTVLFGKEDILINNIAWMLRKFPVFGVFGDGSYRLQPIYVDDLARLAVEQGKSSENVIIDAIGPETFTYRELVKKIGEIIGKERPIISVPDFAGYNIGRLIGRLVGDITITEEEIKGLKANLLWTNSPPAGTTRLTEWTRQNAHMLGVKYANELARRKDREKPYDRL
ncbi:SDR family oxidoreductase [Pelotomaculum propionicicum]|uniref:SDR family oxidoreductase n=1 Tax=Pelotomaculum propionicicum TaxID=258475 RepID=UPI003B7F75B8